MNVILNRIIHRMLRVYLLFFKVVFESSTFSRMKIFISNLRFRQKISLRLHDIKKYYHNRLER